MAAHLLLRQSTGPGCAGYGWETPADIRLEVDAIRRQRGHHDAARPTAPFSSTDFRWPGNDAAELELMDGALLSDHRRRIPGPHQGRSDLPFSQGPGSDHGREESPSTPIARISDLCGNWLAFERQCRQAGWHPGIGRALSASAPRKRPHSQRSAMNCPVRIRNTSFVQYRYDDKGDLVAVIDALGNPYTFAYDAHHMVRHTDRNGLSFYYEYDKSSRRRVACRACLGRRRPLRLPLRVLR